MIGIALLMTINLFGHTAEPKEWAFDVYLDSHKIGIHTFELDEHSKLTSKANFKVKVLIFNAYQYDHLAIERWQDDCLISLDSNTVEDGVTTKVKAIQTLKYLVVNDGNKGADLPLCSMTFAYWNPKILQQSHLLNPQNAEWIDTKVTKLGSEKIDVKGKVTEATHYKLDGSLAGKRKLNIDLWYTNENEWVALKSTTIDGYTINYKLH
ncbi:MAG: hypothetical protein RLZZ541_1158 [Pseudomonadota bacterium]|jgi:hypothetical protein